jgi:hypothetical protein
MNDEPLDQIPEVLTPEAEQDKLRWVETISGLKGKARKQALESFVDRYKELPHLPDVLSR